ncbi:heavy-metal-associated domain-containing protein [Candidatus Chloroploca sp. Khr17]|uniref:heavy-metal-associated domain-containing protein n=1 Tax=Candidatus Chloroploca sp. Khr17 TaxID=2496869 RepID=UPI00101C5F38|nr:heavy-metal-associated domain-containing protein [Candidatus Chloroploca sp. Khr17]
MKTEQFHVPGISCQHCVRAVTDEVGKLVGVASITIDLPSKVVTVASENTLAAETIVAAIREAGYEEVAPVL